MSIYKEYTYDRAIELENLKSPDDRLATGALLAITHNDQDWEWTQDLCIKLLNSPNIHLQYLSVTCLGHIARIHSKINEKKVLAAFNKKMSDPEIVGRIEDAISDINIFTKR